MSPISQNFGHYMQIFFSLQEKLYVTTQVVRFRVGFLIFVPVYIHPFLTPGPDLIQQSFS